MTLHQPPHFSPFFITCRGRLLLLFTLFVARLTQLSGHFNCGEYELRYPFGFKNIGLGDLSLQFECDYGHGRPKPVLHISGKKYYILSPKFYHIFTMGGSMTIIDKKLRDNCDPSSNNYTELRSSPQFHIADTHIDISLGGHCKPEWIDLPNETAGLICNPDWHYNLTAAVNWAKICKEQVVLPVNNTGGPVDEHQILCGGFPIEWNVSKRCRDCMSSGGFCGYNSSSMQFHCNCRHRHRHIPYPDICPADHASWFNTSNKTAIAIVTAIVGSTLLIVALLLIIAYRKKMFFFNHEVPERKGDNPRSISKVETFLNSYVDEMQTRYSYSSLKKITNNFAHKLGEGGFGVVYRGKLPSGTLVAVKMLDQTRQSETQFMNEVATIGRIHHFHLVRLLGYCFEGLTCALVYKYMANGSLDKFILAGKEKDQVLNWNQLHSIALGAARGIAYLHNGCQNRIIHFDIKPHNILLDEEFTAKVADFGLAKLCGRRDDHVSMTAARGTPGYVAPEVWSRNLGPVTDKSDVYSFGMMLLEMVGGRKNIDVQVSRSSQFYFAEWALKLIENGELRTRLRERELAEADEAKARSLAKVGMWCIQYNSVDRPSITEVVHMLEGDADDIPDPPTPFSRQPQPAPFSPSEESSSIEIKTAS